MDNKREIVYENIVENISDGLLAIDRSMSREGKLDGDLVEAFFESQAWKREEA